MWPCFFGVAELTDLNENNKIDHSLKMWVLWVHTVLEGVNKKKLQGQALLGFKEYGLLIKKMLILAKYNEGF